MPSGCQKLSQNRAVTDWYDEVTLFSNKKVDLRHVTRDIVTCLYT